MKCPECGEENPVTNISCRECGTELEPRWDPDYHDYMMGDYDDASASVTGEDM